MRRTRPVRGCLALGTLVIAGCLVPAQAAPPPPRTLTLAGSTTGYTTFDLARASTVTIGDEPGAPASSAQVTLQGRGRMVALVLGRVGRGPQPFLAVVQSGACFVPGCRPGEQSAEYVLSSSSAAPDGGARVVLPAGRYNATLVTDGAPVTATISLGGLARSLSLRPRAKADVQLTDVQPTGGDGPHVATTGGRVYRFGGPAVLALQTYSTSFAGGQQLAGDCLVDGEGPPAQLYAPGCPTADPGASRISAMTQQGSAPDDVSSTQQGSIGLYGPLPAGRSVSAGSWVVSAVPLRQTHMLQLAVALPQSALGSS